MTYNAKKIAIELEAAIDATSLGWVLERLASIAYDKADHIQANYAVTFHVDPLAASWRRDALTLERFAQKVRN